MRALVLWLIAACGSASHPSAPRPWLVPDGWKHELIPFPLDFAPSLSHAGVEEIRFAPGFFKPAEPGYWSYAFVWRLDGNPAFDAATVAAELTTYFRGLVAAVDAKITGGEAIVVTATPGHGQLVLDAHVIDAFTSKQPVELIGTATQLACPAGAVWVFALAPDTSPMRANITALAAQAACGQPTVPNAPR